MARFNTGNPVGSKDPRDLSDNAQNIDEWSNGSGASFSDRLGVQRRTIAGMTDEFQSFLDGSAYDFLGDYAADIEVTSRNQVIREAGEFWRISAGTELPYTTTGAGMPEGGAFAAVGDAVLRQDLAGTDGLDFIGGTGTAAARDVGTSPTQVPDNDAINSRGFAESVASVADLRALTVGPTLERIWLEGYYGQGTPGGGALYVDRADTTSADNGGTVFVTADGARVKRAARSAGVVYLEWWGNQGDQTGNITEALNELLPYNNAGGWTGRGLGKLVLPKGEILCQGEIFIAQPIGLIIEGQGAYSTVLDYTGDGGNLFRFRTYSNVIIKDLSAVSSFHTEPSDYNTTMCIIDGEGGGNNLKFQSVVARRWDTLFESVSASNADTTKLDHCRFEQFKTFLRSNDGAQDIINKVSSCTFISIGDWAEAANAILETNGFQATDFDTCNIIFAGTTLKFLPGTYGVTHLYNFNNCKWEWGSDDTRIIDVNGADVAGQVNFNECVLAGREGNLTGPAAERVTIDTSGANRLSVVWRGGRLPGIVRVASGLMTQWFARMAFENLISGPSTLEIATGPGTSISAGVLPVEFSGCGNINDQIISANGAENSVKTYRRAFARGLFSNLGARYLKGGGASDSEPEYRLPGHSRIKSLSIYIQLVSGVSAKTVEVYSDEARTNKIADIEIPGGTIGGSASSDVDDIFEWVPDSPVFSDEGVYITFIDPDENTQFGYYVVEYESGRNYVPSSGKQFSLRSI